MIEATQDLPQANPGTHHSRRWTGTVWTIQGYGIAIVTFLCFFPRWTHVGEYLFLALLLAACSVAWVEGRKIHVRTALDVPLLLFLAWVLLTVPFATDPGYSFAEWRKLATKVLALYWVLLVFQAQTKKGLAPIVLAAVKVGTVVLCAYAIGEFFLQGGGWEDRSVRAGAPSSDYNWLSTYLVMAIPLVALTGLATRQWPRVLSVAVLCLAFLAQALSYTRAGWLGLAAEGLAFGIFTGWRRFTVFVLAGCLLIATGLLVAAQFGYQRSTVDPWTFNARVEVWKLGAAEVLDHPLVGIGYGSKTFMKRFGTYPEAKNASGPHSLFMMVALGSGLPALLLLIWIFVSAVRTLVGYARRATSPDDFAISIAISIMIIGFATRNGFDYMFAGSVAYLFWILVGTGLAVGKEVEELSPSQAFRFVPGLAGIEASVPEKMHSQVPVSKKS